MRHYTHICICITGKRCKEIGSRLVQWANIERSQVKECVFRPYVSFDLQEHLGGNDNEGT